MRSNTKFSQHGDQWVATVSGMKVVLNKHCMTVFHGENDGLEGVIRFPNSLNDFTVTSFTYSEFGTRAAILLPEDTGHIEIFPRGNTLYLNYFNGNGTLEDKLEVATPLTNNV